MLNTGKEYEIFVQTLMQAILNSELQGGQKNIKVEHNKKIPDRSGIDRQFDVLWEYEQGGIVYKTIIECKDYNSSISIGKVDELIGKLVDFPGIKGIIATTKGYQSGAKEKAKNNNVELLCIREQNDTDWQDAHGTPLVKTISLNMFLRLPVKILEFMPIFDGAWIKENTDIDISKPIHIEALNNQIFIYDAEKNIRCSLLDLASQIKTPDSVSENELLEYTESFSNAFLEYPNMKLKLSSYKIKYTKRMPIKETMEIDFSKILIGVVEYLNQGKKKMVMDNGIVKDMDLEIKT
jgi:hypothetical protein